MPPQNVIARRFHGSQVELSFAEAGTAGTPLVLLHGAASHWQPFLPLFPLLAGKYHLYAIDLRGHGGSSHRPGAYRLDDYTSDIHEFIAKEAGAPALVYGHSLGGLVGIGLAARHPQDVRALVLGDPPLYYHDTLTKDTFWPAAFQELLDFQSAHPDPLEMNAWLTQNYPGMPPERREERVRSLQGFDPGVLQSIISDELMQAAPLVRLVPQVQCPVILLRGDPELGSVLRDQDVTYAAGSFRDFRLLEMKTIGHGIIPVPLLPLLMGLLDGT